MMKLYYLLLLTNIVFGIVPIDSVDEHRIKCITPAQPMENAEDCRFVSYQYVFKDSCLMVTSVEDICGPFKDLDECNKCAKLFKKTEKKELNVEEYMKGAKEQNPPSFNAGQLDV